MQTVSILPVCGSGILIRVYHLYLSIPRTSTPLIISSISESGTNLYTSNKQHESQK